MFCFLSSLALTDKTIPKAKQVIQIEVPPLVIKGKFCPVTGNNPTDTPILMNACKTMGIPTPITNNFPNIVEDFVDIATNLKSIATKKNIIITPPNSPYSSIMIEKIKSEEL